MSRPTMPSTAPRWAARLQLLRGLWEGRDRVLLDPAIERLLTAARLPRDPCGALVDDLLGREMGQGRVRLFAGDHRHLAGARRFPGLDLHDVDTAAAVLDREPWEVALVDLSPYLGEDATPSRVRRRELPGLGRRLDRRALALLDSLADGVARGRGVALTVTAEGIRAAEFQALIEACFERGRLLGLASLPVIAAVDFGVIDRRDDGRGGDSEPLSIAFDNSLGAAPRFAEYLAIVGVDVPGGLTLLEIPAAPESPRGASDTLRIQLAQARRQIEIATAARESLVEQIDAAQSRASALEARCAALETRLAEAAWGSEEPGGGPPEGEDGHREREALGGAGLRATVQSLRWELEGAQAALRELAERPVSALEAENASLRARLEGEPVGEAVGAGGAGDPALGRVQAAVDLLRRRVERGGIGERELGRKLAELAELLAELLGGSQAPEAG